MHQLSFLPGTSHAGHNSYSVLKIGLVETLKGGQGTAYADIENKAHRSIELFLRQRLVFYVPPYACLGPADGRCKSRFHLYWG